MSIKEKSLLNLNSKKQYKINCLLENHNRLDLMPNIRKFKKQYPKYQFMRDFKNKLPISNYS